MKGVINTIQVATKRVVKLEHVTDVVVSNLSANAGEFVLNGVKRVLPPLDADYNIPVAPFQIGVGDSIPFDVELNITMGGSNLIVIDYKEIPNPKC